MSNVLIYKNGEVDFDSIEKLSCNSLDWLITKLILCEKKKDGEYIKQWYQEAVDNGEESQPYSTDWSWCGELIEQYCIDLLSGPAMRAVIS